MDKTNPNEALETGFITTEQTVALTRILDLTMEEVDQVAGGECSCVNCCSHVRQMAVKA